MALEIERKYRFSDFAVLRTRLRDVQAAYGGRDLEQNAVWDTPSRNLTEQGILLRLRSVGGESVLCLKKPPVASKVDDRNKVFEETETGVADREAMGTILRDLGYEIAFRYEKLRETWRMASVTVCLDHLPFGRYVELEGSEQSIPWAEDVLGLQGCPSTTMNYHQLNKAHLRERGFQEQDSFVFSDAERERLKERLARSGH
ncbi:MAG: class IV adenylate cyclase [Desulfohalobiaceae bacterium]